MSWLLLIRPLAPACAALGIFSLAAFFSPVQARTWHVFADGTGDAPTIQAGIDSSAAGDTVSIGPGTYHENIDFLGKNIVVKSSDGPEGTIIDGSGLGRYVVYFHSHEGRSAILEGLTVTGGGIGVFIWQAEPSIIANVVQGNRGSGGYIGAGVLMSGDGEPGPWSPLIKGNTVVNNEAKWTSGGIGCQKKMTPEILNNYIAYNRAPIGDGAGIWILVEFDGTIIRDNAIESNVAGDHGGGIYFYGLGSTTPTAEIDHNVLYGNTAEGQEHTGDSGGGIWLESTNAWVHHNTIVQNTGAGGGTPTEAGLPSPINQGRHSSNRTSSLTPWMAAGFTAMIRPPRPSATTSLGRIREAREPAPAPIGR